MLNKQKLRLNLDGSGREDVALTALILTLHLALKLQEQVLRSS